MIILYMEKNDSIRVQFAYFKTGIVGSALQVENYGSRYFLLYSLQCSSTF